MIKIDDFITDCLLVYYVIIIHVILKPYNHNAHDLLLLQLIINIAYSIIIAW